MTPNEIAVVQQMVDALKHAIACFDAAETEGLRDRIADFKDASACSLSGLLQRRLLYATAKAPDAIAAGESLLAQPPALGAGAERETLPFDKEAWADAVWSAMRHIVLTDPLVIRGMNIHTIRMFCEASWEALKNSSGKPSDPRVPAVSAQAQEPINTGIAGAPDDTALLRQALEALEQCKVMWPLRPGDVEKYHATMAALRSRLGEKL